MKTTSLESTTTQQQQDSSKSVLHGLPATGADIPIKEIPKNFSKEFNDFNRGMSQREIDRNREYIKASKLPLPVQAENFKDAGIAMTSSLNYFLGSESYKNLPLDQKAGARTFFYNKVIVPAYEKFKQPPPSYAEWMVNTSPYTKAEELDKIVPGISKDILGFSKGTMALAPAITLAGTKVALNTYLWLRSAKTIGYDPATLTTNQNEQNDIVRHSAFYQGLNFVKDHIDRANASITGYELNNPARNATEKYLSLEGELLAQLPVFEAAGAFNVVEGLAGKLGASKAGTYALSKLATGLTGFGLAEVAGQSHKAAAFEGLTWVGFEAGQDAGIAAATGIYRAGKKLTSAVLRAGGAPFAAHVSSEAAAMLNRMKTPEAAHLLDMPTEPNTDYNQVIKNSSPPLDIETRQALRESNPAAAASAAYGGDITIRGMKPEERADALRNMFLPKDPLLAKLTSAEATILSVLSRETYGKSFHLLTPEEQQTILKLRGSQVADVAHETAIHDPEAAMEEIHKELEENAKTSGNKERLSAALNGKDPAKVLMAEAVEQATAHEAKTTTQKGVVDNIIKPISELSSDEDAEYYDSYTDSNLDDTKGKKVSKTEDGIKTTIQDTPNGRSVSVSAYNDFRQNYVHKVIQEAKLLSENAPKEKFLAFVDNVEDRINNEIKFENPSHALVYAWTYKNELTRTQREKLFQELQARIGIRSKEDLDYLNKRIHEHIDALVRTGRLIKGEPVFRSTAIGYDSKTGTFKDPTIYQVQLHSEGFNKQIAQINKMLRGKKVAQREFNAQINAAKKLVKAYPTKTYAHDKFVSTTEALQKQIDDLDYELTRYIEERRIDRKLRKYMGGAK